MWTLFKKILLLFCFFPPPFLYRCSSPAFRVGEPVCAPSPSDTVYPKTHKASAPKKKKPTRPASPDRKTAPYRLTLQEHCVITHSLKCAPLPSPANLTPSPFTHMLCGLEWAIIGMFGMMHAPLSPTVYSRHNSRWTCSWSRGRRTAKTSETSSVPVGRSYPRRQSAPCAGGGAGRCRSIPGV